MFAHAHGKEPSPLYVKIYVLSGNNLEMWDVKDRV